MGFDAKGIKAGGMGSTEPIINGAKWKMLVQKENYGTSRSKVLTYENPVGGKRNHGERETINEETNLKKKGKPCYTHFLLIVSTQFL